MSWRRHSGKICRLMYASWFSLIYRLESISFLSEFEIRVNGCVRLCRVYLLHTWEVKYFLQVKYEIRTFSNKSPSLITVPQLAASLWLFYFCGLHPKYLVYSHHSRYLYCSWQESFSLDWRLDKIALHTLSLEWVYELVNIIFIR